MTEPCTMQPLDLLVIEDAPADVELVGDALREAGLVIAVRAVVDEAGLRRALDERLPVAILSDWTLPGFSGGKALEVARERCPQVPFIFVSGTISEASAFEGMRRGAVDYVYKHQLQQLAPILSRALDEARARRLLRESEERYRQLFESSRDALVVLSPSTSRFTNANAAARDLFAVARDADVTLLGPMDALPERQPDGRLSTEQFQEDVAIALREGSYFSELECRRFSGETFPADVLVTRTEVGGQTLLQITVRDITERKQAEKSLQQVNRALRTLSAGNEALVRANSEEELLRTAMRIIVERGSYQLAWVVYPGAQTNSHPVPVAHFGDEIAYQCHAALKGDPEHERHCLTIAAIRDRKTQLCNDLHKTPECNFPTLREAGVAAILAMPLLYNDDIVGALTIFSSSRDGFDKEELKLLQELASDIAYGIGTQRARAALHASELALRESEKKLSAVTATAQDAIAMIDDDGNVRYWNPAAERLFGYTAAEMMGRNMHQLIVPERYKTAHDAGFAKFRESGSGPAVGRTTELFAVASDGREFPVEISLSSVKLGGRWYGVGIVRDITERKRSESELKWKTAFLEALVKSSADGILVVDSQARKIVQNRRMIEMWKIPKAITEDPDDTALWQFVMKQIVDAKQFVEKVRYLYDHPDEISEDEILTKDGMVFHRFSSPVQDAAGVNYGRIWSFRDITERKHAEIKLRTSELRYRRLFEAAKDGILILDADTGMVMEVNPFLIQMMGYSREEFLDKHIWELGFLRNVAANKDKFLELQRQDYVRYEDMPLEAKSGKTLHVEFVSNVYKVDEIRVVQCNIRDISARKAAEEEVRKLSLAIEQSPESVVITDLDANIEYVNEAFLQITGYSREEVLGRNPRILQSGKTPRATYDALWDALTHGRTWHGEFINRRKTGSEYIEYATITPIRQENGQISHYVAVKEDITEKKRIDAELEQHRHHLEELVTTRTQELEEAMQVAEAANAAKSTFVANMSHEIRTPMNGVIGMLDVLQQSSLNGKQIEIVNIIHDSAFSLLSIIDDILDFSKIEAGKLQVECVPMSIADVIEKACETMDRLAMKSEVELTLFVDPAIPPVVMGDPGRLRQILVNLTNNAIKFSGGRGPAGRVWVRAGLAMESPPEGDSNMVMIEFRVTDNGIGIDEQTQARLFTSFTQADSSTTRNYGGTGLGLAITRHLVSLKGGTIAIQSRLGQGSSFIVHLPFTLATEQAEAIEGPSLDAGLHCLVVGDEESLAGNIAIYLTQAGAQVEQVPEWSAVQAWRAGQPSDMCIVVVDTARSNPQLDELRGSVHIPVEQKTGFVVIGRGQRREPRLEDDDLVSVDGNVLTRATLLRAVAIAAGRAKASEREYRPDNVKSTLAPMSREAARRRGSLILIAEDNEINQKVIMQQLTLLGHTADIASNGREALVGWQSGDYALLFTDLHMPEMDGYELTAAIRAGEKTGKARTPIIAFTANALKGEAEHCLAMGMDDYLSKPVQLVNLKAMLEKWMPIAAAPIPAPETKAAAPADTIPVDVNVLKKLVGDDDAVIRDFLHDFRLSAVKLSSELRTACTAGKISDAASLAHKLKSSARSVGALALGELCAEMEHAGKANNAEALVQLLPRFEQELANVEQFLEGY